mmetsp:Transcript_24443/g.36619  ORF Transcript_24443/g.36619 Transcript_24443/m.36619 type:complete len:89 (-) Transcript_24443:128-394(-)
MMPPSGAEPNRRLLIMSHENGPISPCFCIRVSSIIIHPALCTCTRIAACGCRQMRVVDTEEFQLGGGKNVSENNDDRSIISVLLQPTS